MPKLFNAAVTIVVPIVANNEEEAKQFIVEQGFPELDLDPSEVDIFAAEDGQRYLRIEEEHSIHSTEGRYTLREARKL